MSIPFHGLVTVSWVTLIMASSAIQNQQICFRVWGAHYRIVEVFKKKKVMFQNYLVNDVAY